uniref:Uncharacterized protein n=1 Tax=Aegilops tauschii subsp. strangulata TaxID=200361 RepID=A0A453PQJ3_AEGTS
RGQQEYTYTPSTSHLDETTNDLSRMACVEEAKVMESCMVEEVKVVECSMVTPSEEMPRHGLWLSPPDLMMVNRGHTPTIYFYRAASGDDFFDVAKLKAAMAKALVPFYPLAGRLGVDGNGRPEIDCTGRGARFVVAPQGLQRPPAVAGADEALRPQGHRRCHARRPGDLLQVRWGGPRHGAAPRRHRRPKRVPLLPDVVRLLERRGWGWRWSSRGGAGAAMPRPHPPPRTLPATRRQPRLSLRVLVPQERPKHTRIGAIWACRQREFCSFQRPGRRSEACLRWREHILHPQCPRVALHVRRPAAADGRRDAAQLPG